MRASLFVIICLGANVFVASTHRNDKRYKSARWMQTWCRDPLSDGIRVPWRKRLLDLITWKQKIEGKTMYQMYFGSDHTDFETVLQDPEFVFHLDAEDKMKPTFSAVYNGSCVDESLLGSTEYDTFSTKAEFRQGSNYYSFWSSDPEHYHWNLLCSDFDFQSGRCPVDKMAISLFVHDFPPHNLPMQDVARDLYTGTCLTMDLAATEFPFFFTYGENDANTSAPDCIISLGYEAIKAILDRILNHDGGRSTTHGHGEWERAGCSREGDEPVGAGIARLLLRLQNTDNGIFLYAVYPLQYLIPTGRFPVHAVLCTGFSNCHEGTHTYPRRNREILKMSVSQQPMGQRERAPLVAPVKGNRDWDQGLFGCFSDCKSLIMACCCMPCMVCRVSSLQGDCPLMPWCVPGAPIAMRARIRTLGGIEGSICKDCIISSLCGFCSMIQIEHELTAMGVGL